MWGNYLTEHEERRLRRFAGDQRPPPHSDGRRLPSWDPSADHWLPQPGTGRPIMSTYGVDPFPDTVKEMSEVEELRQQVDSLRILFERDAYEWTTDPADFNQSEGTGWPRDHSRYGHTYYHEGAHHCTDDYLEEHDADGPAYCDRDGYYYSHYSNSTRTTATTPTQHVLQVPRSGSRPPPPQQGGGHGLLPTTSDPTGLEAIGNTDFPAPATRGSPSQYYHNLLCSPLCTSGRGCPRRGLGSSPRSNTLPCNNQGFNRGCDGCKGRGQQIWPSFHGLGTHTWVLAQAGMLSCGPPQRLRGIQCCP